MGNFVRHNDDLPVMFPRFNDFPQDIRLMIWEEHFLGCFGERKRGFHLPIEDLMKAEFLRSIPGKEHWLPCEFCEQSRTMYLAENLRAHLESHRTNTSEWGGATVSPEVVHAAIDRMFSSFPPGIKDADLEDLPNEAVGIARAMRRHFPVMDFRCEPPGIKTMSQIHRPTHVNWYTDLVYFDLPRVVTQDYRDKPFATPAWALGMASFSRNIRALALNVELGYGHQVGVDVIQALDAMRALPALRDLFLLIRPAKYPKMNCQSTLLSCLRALPEKESNFFTTRSLAHFQREYDWPSWSTRGRGSWSPEVWGMPVMVEASDQVRTAVWMKYENLLRHVTNTLSQEARSVKKVHWVFQNGV